MAISLTSSGITVGGTSSNIITAFGSNILCSGYITRTISPSYSSSTYTCSDPGIGGIIAIGKYGDSTGIKLPSSGAYIATFITYRSNGSNMKPTMTLTSTGTLYAGGTTKTESASNSDTYASVFCLAVRVM